MISRGIAGSLRRFIETFMGTFMGTFGGGVIDLLYPPHCAACGCTIFRDGPESAADMETLCAECRRGITPSPGNCCPVCSHTMTGMLMCPNCEGRRWHLSVIVAACRYEGLVRELIQRFKYGRDQSLIRALAPLLRAAFDDPRIQGKRFDAIVPVPLHSLREREREFNQSALLATHLGKQLGIPVRQYLKRTRPTAPQAGFDRAARMKNLEGAFDLAKGMEIPPDACLLLVDDVSTTGSTLDACAAVLLEAGAAEVCAVTVARG